MFFSGTFIGNSDTLEGNCYRAPRAACGRRLKTSLAMLTIAAFRSICRTIRPKAHYPASRPSAKLSRGARETDLMMPALMTHVGALRAHETSARDPHHANVAY